MLLFLFILVIEGTIWQERLGPSGCNYVKQPMLSIPLDPNHSPKIYIYDLPRYLHGVCENITTPLPGSSANIEFLFPSWLRNSPYYTSDPKKATMFYVPAIPDCVRFLSSNIVSKRQVYAAQYLNNVIYYIKQFSWFDRYQGQDHVFTFMHDYGRCFTFFADHAKDEWIQHIPELSKMALALHKVVQIGAFSAPGFASCGSPCSDLIAPAFIGNTGHAVPGEYVLDRGQPKGRKSILAFFSGRIHADAYAGSGLIYSDGVRQKLWEEYRSDPDILILVESIWAHRPAIRYFQEATFCFCPPGWAHWSPRIAESIAIGCIPVVFEDLGLYLPYWRLVDYNKIAIVSNKTEIGSRLKQRLVGMSEEEIKHRQMLMQKVARCMVWETDTVVNAYECLMTELAIRLLSQGS